MADSIKVITAIPSRFDSDRDCFSWAGGGKRLFDVVVAALALFLLAPLIGALAVLIHYSDGGPALFAQERVGRNGHRFKFYKFRSMTVDAESVLATHLANDAQAYAEWAVHRKLKRDPRITPLGRFLRRTSLDELPQLFNVLKGEMSLIGPRPIVAQEISNYGIAFPICFSVRPGITGIWQVSGRSDLTYEQRVRLDAHYARKGGALLDLIILVRTIPAVLAQAGSY